MVEVGVVTLDPSGTVQERWHTLVNPGRDLGAQAIHGISGAEVMDAPYFHQIIPELTSYLRNLVDQHAHRASGRDNNRRVVVGINAILSHSLLRNRALVCGVELSSSTKPWRDSRNLVKLA